MKALFFWLIHPHLLFKGIYSLFVGPCVNHSFHDWQHISNAPYTDFLRAPANAPSYAEWMCSKCGVFGQRVRHTNHEFSIMEIKIEEVSSLKEHVA